jgi:serine protease Do
MYRVNALGLYVWSVTKGSDADLAGLEPADRVLSIDGQEVQTVAQANAVLDGKKVGDKVRIAVERNNQKQTFEITLSEYKPS